MSITYTPTTNFGAKDGLPANDSNKVVKGAEFTTEFTAIQGAFALAAPTSNPTFTGTATFDDVTATGGIAATLTTAAQPNITSVGKLTGFESTGIDDNATSTAITIDASENVGIGAAPTGLSSYKTLEIQGGADVGSALKLTTSEGEGGQLFNFNSTLYAGGYGATILGVGDATIGADFKNAYRIDTSGLHRWYDPTDGSTERMRIDSLGRLGIGDPAPETQIEATAPDTTTDAALTLSVPSGATADPLTNYRLIGNTIWSAGADSTDGYFKIGRGGTLNNLSSASFTLDSTGKVGMGISTPSAALHVSPAEEGTGDQGPVSVKLGNSNASGRAAEIIKNTTAPRDLTIRASTSAADPEDIVFELDAATEAMRIAATGNVGIGTDDPQAPLDVKASMAITGTTGPLLRMQKFDGTLDTAMYYNNSNADNKLLVGRDSSVLGFRTSGTERMTVDASGNVGIGAAPTAISSYKTLEIQGGADAGGAIKLSTTEGEGGQLFNYNNILYAGGYGATILGVGDVNIPSNFKNAYRADTSGLHRWYDPTDGSTERMRIESNGDVRIGTGTDPVTLNLGDGGNSVNATLNMLTQTNTLTIGADGTMTNDESTSNGDFTFRTTPAGGSTATAATIKGTGAMNLEPRATAPSSPAAGDLYFDSTLSKLRCYDGTAWNNCF
jgi:hypothetical protein